MLKLKTINSMKKIILICTVLIGGTAIAQNVLPNSGSVGIGTTSPEQKLQVKGNIKADSCVIVGDSLIVKKDARIQKDMKVEGLLYVNKDIIGNKDLGINKNASIGKNLTVDKKIIATNMVEANNLNNKSIVVRQENGVLKTIPFGAIALEIYKPIACPEDVNGNPVILPPSWSNGPAKIYTGTSECTGNTKVGIGEANPDAKLEIKVNSEETEDALLIKSEDRNILIVKSNGLVRAREIKVDAQEWPDYVFEEEYVLMPLNEIEKFIQEEGHLPNVPSAKEIEEDGQNLGDMNKILMEKVEELTLHLINQQKQIDELNKKVQSVSNSQK
jgi:hypothetical protein